MDETLPGETAPSDALPIPEDQQEAMDVLFSQSVNQETIADAKKDMQMEEGTYLRTEDPATVTIDTHPSTGRKGFNVFGPFVNAKDPKIKGRLRFRVSWERANKLVRDDATGEEIDTGKPDIKTRLYVNLVDAYKKVHGEPPKNLGQLAQYLANAPYKVRTMNGDDSEIVLNLTPMK
jgi:hypothetical protein